MVDKIDKWLIIYKLLSSLNDAFYMEFLDYFKSFRQDRFVLIMI